MPGMTGLELQEALLARTSTLPTIILTGHGDVPMAVRAMSKGSLDFMQKPFNGPQLLERVQAASALSLQLLANKSCRTEILSRYKSLTFREEEVMEKMQVRSVTELVHAAMQLKA